MDYFGSLLRTSDGRTAASDTSDSDDTGRTGAVLGPDRWHQCRGGTSLRHSPPCPLAPTRPGARVESRDDEGLLGRRRFDEDISRKLERSNGTLDYIYPYCYTEWTSTVDSGHG